MAKKTGKSGNNLRRTPGNTPGRDLILIVVEGKKTEPQYFESMRQELKLATAKIEIVSASGGSPLEVVKKANKSVNKKKYEKVFCVFDYDNKPNQYQAAISAATDYNFEQPITSRPCFEFWYLLHYRYSTRPFQDCDETTKELEKELGENYQKKLDFCKLKPRLEDAIANADKLIERQEEENEPFPNPQTKVHILVKYLQKQKNSIPPNSEKIGK